MGVREPGSSLSSQRNVQMRVLTINDGEMAAFNLNESSKNPGLFGKWQTKDSGGRTEPKKNTLEMNQAALLPKICIFLSIFYILPCFKYLL